jgi:hypothetical protein
MSWTGIETVSLEYSGYLFEDNICILHIVEFIVRTFLLAFEVLISNYC